MANSTLRGKALFKNAANTVKVVNRFAVKSDGLTHNLAKQMYGDVLNLVNNSGTLLHPITSDPKFRKKARWFGRNITTGSKNAIAIGVAVALGGPGAVALAGGGILIGFLYTQTVKFRETSKADKGLVAIEKAKDKGDVTSAASYWGYMGKIIRYKNNSLNEVMNLCAEFENDRRALMELIKDGIKTDSCDDCWRLLEHFARCELRVVQVSEASDILTELRQFIDNYLRYLDVEGGKLRSKSIARTRMILNLSPQEMLENLSAAAHHKTVFNTGGFIYGSYGSHEQWVKDTNPELSGGGAGPGGVGQSMGLSDIAGRHGGKAFTAASLGNAIKTVVSPQNTPMSAAVGGLTSSVVSVALDAVQAYYDAKALKAVQEQLKKLEDDGHDKFEILEQIQKKDVEALRKEAKQIIVTLCSKISEIKKVVDDLAMDADLKVHSLEQRCVTVVRFVKLYYEIVEVRKSFDAFHTCTFDRTMSFETDTKHPSALPQLRQKVFDKVNGYIYRHKIAPCDIKNHVCYMDSAYGMEDECKLHNIGVPPEVDKRRWAGIPVHPGPRGVSERTGQQPQTGLRRSIDAKKNGGKFWD